MQLLFTNGFEIVCKLYCVVIGWAGEVKEGTLVFFKLETIKTGPEIVLSLSIKEDFPSTVYYRREIVDKDCCSILKNMPSSINTGMQICS